MTTGMNDAGRPITVQLRFFASLREAFGAGETLALAEPVSVDTVRELLTQRGGDYARLLDPGRAVRAALDQTVCDGGAWIDKDVELAFFPPVTGG